MFELNKIYNEECLQSMKQFPDKYFDWCIADPPYGINADSGIGGAGLCANNVYTQKDWDNKRLDKIYFDEMRRISKNQIFFGGNYYTDYLEPTKSWLIWDKRCDDKQENNFADCEMAWCSCNQARVIRHLWKGMLQENMKNKEQRFHPTQKPVSLYQKIIKKYEVSGKVIDPFLGSASSIIAYIDNKIDYVGFELDKEYFDIASKRIQDRLNQPTFFDTILEETPRTQTTLFD